MKLTKNPILFYNFTKFVGSFFVRNSTKRVKEGNLKKGKELRKRDAFCVERALCDSGLYVKRRAVMVVDNEETLAHIEEERKKTERLSILPGEDLNEMRVWELRGNRGNILAAEPEFDGRGLA